MSIDNDYLELVFRLTAGLSGSMLVLHILLSVFFVISLLLDEGEAFLASASLNASLGIDFLGSLLVSFEAGLIISYVVSVLYFLKGTVETFGGTSADGSAYSAGYDASDWPKSWRTVKTSGTAVPFVLLVSVVLASLITTGYSDISEFPLIGRLNFLIGYFPGQTLSGRVALVVAAVPAAVFFRGTSTLYGRYYDIKDPSGARAVIYLLTVFVGFLLLLNYIQSAGLPELMFFE
jgi:hypothetical protein